MNKEIKRCDNETCEKATYRDVIPGGSPVKSNYSARTEQAMDTARRLYDLGWPIYQIEDVVPLNFAQIARIVGLSELEYQEQMNRKDENE